MKFLLFVLFYFLFLTTIYVSGQDTGLLYQPFRTGLKWGIKDTSGNVILSPVFNFIFKQNQTGFFVAASAKAIYKYLKYDSLKSEIKEISDFTSYVPDDYNDVYEDDSIVYLYKPVFFLIDKTGNMITNDNYDEIISYDHCYICRKSDQYYFISADGKTKGPWGYYYSLIDNNNDKEYPDYYIVNYGGENKVYFQYDTVASYESETEEMLMKVYEAQIDFRKGGSFSILNYIGESIINKDFEDLRISTIRKDAGYYDAVISFNPFQSVSDSSSWEYFSDRIDVMKFIFGKTNGKWGLFNWKGETLIPFEYDSLEIYSFNREYLFKGFKNGKYMFVKPGKNPSPPFDNFIELAKPDSSGDYNTGYFVIQNGGTLRNILTKKDSIYIENWETGETMFKIIEEYTPCFSGGKFRILNKNLEQITNDEYDSLQFFVNDYSNIEYVATLLRNFSDSTSKTLGVELPPDYPFLTCKNGLWGAISPDGKELISNKYHSLKQLFFNGKQVIETGCDGLSGIVSMEGKELLEPVYQNFISLKSDISGINWQNSEAIFYRNGKMGVVNMNGIEIIPSVFDSIFFDNGYFIVNTGGKRKHINVEHLRNDLEYIYDSSYYFCHVYDNLFFMNGNWGVYDTIGNPLIGNKYDNLSFPCIYVVESEESSSYVYGDLFLFTMGGKNKLSEINEHDTILELNDYMEFPDLFPYAEKRLKCNTNYPFSGVKYGLVDKTGKEIISRCDTIVLVDWDLTDINNEKYLINYIALKDNNFIVFDKSGKEIRTVEDISLIVNSLIPYYDNNKMLYGLMNKFGRRIVPPAFSYIGSFKEDLCLVRKGSRFGFINNKGDVVIPAQFDEAESFSSGKAKVKQAGAGGGKSFYIDKTGKVVN